MKKTERYIVLSILLSFFILYINKVRCYKRNSTNSDFSALYVHRTDQQLTWSKKPRTINYEWESGTVPSFDELILSWNAIRPSSGFLRFKVSLFYQKRWSPYRKIAEWGKNIQRTFGHEGSSHVHTKYVRVEMQNKRLASRFKIQVSAHNGAHIKNLHGLFASLSRLEHFKKSHSIAQLPSVRLERVPTFTQWTGSHPRCKDFCSPTSMSMMIRYVKNTFLGEKIRTPLSEKELVSCADLMHDHSLDIYGNWLMNVAHAYHLTEGKLFYAVCRLNNFTALHRHLTKKMPVAVSIRGTLRGGALPYQNGHFILVTGWDAKRKMVRCIDPAFKNIKKTGRWYHYADFIEAWGRSRNLSYVVLMKKEINSGILKK